MNELAPKLKNVEKLAAQFAADPEKLLTAEQAVETARAYREKKVKPLLAGIVKVLRSIYHSYLDLLQRFERLQKKYNYEVPTLMNQLTAAQEKNKSLRAVAENYNRVYGPERVEVTVEAVRQQEEAKKQHAHIFQHQYEHAER
jgi:hypothetical protein